MERSGYKITYTCRYGVNSPDHISRHMQRIEPDLRNGKLKVHKKTVFTMFAKWTTRRRPQWYKSHSSLRFLMLLTPVWALVLCCRGSLHNTNHIRYRRLFCLALNRSFVQSSALAHSLLKNVIFLSFWIIISIRHEFSSALQFSLCYCPAHQMMVTCSIHQRLEQIRRTLNTVNKNIL